MILIQNILFSEIELHWSLIRDRIFIFDYVERQVEQLKKVSKQDVIDLFKKYILKGSPQRKKVSSQVYGCEHPMPSPNSIEEELKENEKLVFIEEGSEREFTSSLGEYPPEGLVWPPIHISMGKIEQANKSKL